jgi:hypothetical protein
VAQLRELARAHANPRCGRHHREVAEQLVEHARTLPFEDSWRVVQRWEALADVHGAHRDHEAAHHDRNAEDAVIGPEFHLSAHGGAAQGAEMHAIFDHFVEAELHADWDACAARDGADADAARLGRTAPRRRFDALHAIFLAAASTAPGAQPPEPVVDVVIDLATFEAAFAAAVTDSPIVTPPPPADPRRRRCETLDGAARPARRRRCRCGRSRLPSRVRRGVHHDRSRPGQPPVHRPRPPRRVVAGHPVYPARLGAPTLRDDHATAWNDHGATRPDNGSPLCARHNRWKTRGYHTWRDVAGVWHIHRPDSTEITAA